MSYYGTGGGRGGGWGDNGHQDNRNNGNRSGGGGYSGQGHSRKHHRRHNDHHKGRDYPRSEHHHQAYGWNAETEQTSRSRYYQNKRSKYCSPQSATTSPSWRTQRSTPQSQSTAMEVDLSTVQQPTHVSTPAPLEEYQLRRSNLEELMQVPTLPERYQKLEQLYKENEEHYSMLFFPDDVGKLSLLPQSQLMDWKAKHTCAVAQLREEILTLFPLAQETDTDDSDQREYMSNFGYSGITGQQDRANAQCLLEGLGHCTPLTVGFNTIPLFLENSQNSYCYCACSNRLKGWRKFAGIEEIFDCGGNPNKKHPRDLWSHIRTKCGFTTNKQAMEFDVNKDSTGYNGCKYHLVVWLFLRRLCQDYHGEGLRHIALYNAKDDGYEKAFNLINKKIHKQIYSLQKIEEEHKEERERVAKLEKEMQNLRKTNGDMANKLGAVQKVKAMLEATSKEKELNVPQTQHAQERFDQFLEEMRGRLDKDEVVHELEVVITVREDFHITNLFETWYKGYTRMLIPENTILQCDPNHFGFLFSALKGDDHMTYTQQWQVQDQWRIQIEKENDLADVQGTVDQGGPTRFFFDRLWNQLADLEIRLPGDEAIELFERSNGGLKPVTDDTITNQLNVAKILKQEDRETVESQVECYFRAFGRILAHCLLLRYNFANEDETPNRIGPLPIAQHVFPQIYMNVFLRGLGIEGVDYVSGALVDHSVDLFDIDYEDKEAAFRTLQLYLGMEEDEHDLQKMRLQVRNLFFDDRSIAVMGLRNGLSLGEVVDWDTQLHWIPTSTFRKLAFAGQRITREMVFDKNNKFRLITFQQDARDQRLSNGFFEQQENFKAELEQFFSQKLDSDPEFVTTFVSWCTGSRYIPDLDLNPDFKITIEFNQSGFAREDGGDEPSEQLDDMLPKVHTCTKELLIPASAYDGNMEKFEEKLTQAFEYTGRNFDMK